MSFTSRCPTIDKCKRRTYDHNLIAEAYSDVKTKHLSVAKAAKLYGIPESTLRDRTLNLQPVDDEVNPGPNPTFSKDHESILVNHVMFMSTIGYEYSRKEFITIATDYAISLKVKSPDDSSFSQSWYKGFKKRHPELAIAKPLKLSIVRAKSASARILDSYFNELEQLLETKGVTDHPNNIWNIDETVLEMENTTQTEGSNSKNYLTIIAAGNAAGTRLPPYYIFPGKKWSDGFLAGTSPGTNGCVTESGCLNCRVFRDYLENHFMKNVSTGGLPVIVLIDGHMSYGNLTLSDWASEHNIKLFVVPPHTSCITEAQHDVGFFGPLKNAYYSECQEYVNETPGKQITNRNIAKLSSRAYNKELTPETLIESFRNAGVYPTDRTQITPSDTDHSADYQEEVLTRKTDGEQDSFSTGQKIAPPATSQRKRASSPPSENHRSPSKKVLLHASENDTSLINSLSKKSKKALLNEINVLNDDQKKKKTASKTVKKTTKKQPVPLASTAHSHETYTDSG